MPTGYTCIIEDNATTTFRDFAIRCAHGMGALIHQYDESADSPIRMPTTDSHCHEMAAKYRAEADAYARLTPENARAMFDEEVNRVRTANADALREAAEKNARYGRIRAEVCAWQPPSEEHEGVKKFMLEQIDLCYPVVAYLAKEPFNNICLRDEKKTQAKRMADSYEESARKEERRVRLATAWIDAFLKSLPGDGPRG